MLAHEGVAGGGADEPPMAAAARVYERLHTHLAPLVGDAGVEALLVRSARLAQGELAWLSEVPIADRSAKLRASLHAQEAAVGAESLAALYGTFFALLASLIGERLTTQVLRGAWPMIDEIAPRETDQ